MSKKHSKKKSTKSKIAANNMQEITRNIGICAMLAILGIIGYYASKSTTAYLDWYLGLPIQFGLAMVMAYPLIFKNNIGFFAAILSFGLINYIDIYSELGKFMFNYADINIFEAFIVMGVYAYSLRKIAFKNEDSKQLLLTNSLAYFLSGVVFYLAYALSSSLLYPVYNLFTVSVLDGLNKFNFNQPIVFYSFNEFLLTSVVALIFVTASKHFPMKSNG